MIKENYQTEQYHYAGNDFRTEIALRWGIFFTRSEIDFEYEKQFFELQDGSWYLPSFYIPHLNSWVEVSDTNDKKIEKRIEELSSITNNPVYFFYGYLPDVYFFFDKFSLSTDKLSATAIHSGNFYDCSYTWCSCRNCGFIGIEYEGRSDRLGCSCRKDCKKDYHIGKKYVENLIYAKNYKIKEIRWTKI